MGADNFVELLVDAGIMTRPDPVSESTNMSTAAAVESDTDEESPSVSVLGESVCGDNLILRNEATAPSDGLVGSSRLADEDAAGDEAAAPAACCASELDPDVPLSEQSQCNDLAQLPPHAPAETINAISRSWEGESPDEPRCNPARPEPRLPGTTQSRLDDAPSHDAVGSAFEGEPEDLPPEDGRCKEICAQHEETLDQPPAFANGPGWFGENLRFRRDAWPYVSSLGIDRRIGDARRHPACFRRRGVSAGCREPRQAARAHGQSRTRFTYRCRTQSATVGDVCREANVGEKAVASRQDRGP